MRTIKRQIVTAYIISSDNKLLLGMKDPAGGGTYVNYWHNPGGGVEPDETELEAVKREVREETGLDVSQCEIQLIDHETGQSPKRQPDGEEVLVNMKIAVYKISLDQMHNEVKLAAADDLSTLKWFPLEHLSKIDLTPPAKKLLARIGTDWISASV